jgi:phosphohistidine phosphatase
MNIYLLRHGACEEQRAGLEDGDRGLTPEGRASITDALPGMRNLIGQVDFVLTSPMTRAMETAMIVAGYFKCTGFVEPLGGLAAPGNEARISSRLNKLIGKENILVVGHMPYLGSLARYMVGDSAEHQVDLKKGGMAKLYCKGFPGPESAMLRWVMTADELKKTGEAPPKNKNGE